MAGSTGLEPAASGVTGRRSNQLNYDPKHVVFGGPPSLICSYGGHPSPRARLAGLPSEARQGKRRMVGGAGFEPATAGV